MGAEGFHGRVRDGIGWNSPRYGHQAVDPRREDSLSGDPLSPFGLLERVPVFLTYPRAFGALSPFGYMSAFGEACDDRCVCPRRPWIPVWDLGCGGWFGIKPLEPLVPVSFTRCRASTPGLSTWWSTTALRRDLVLRGASRLDAFSGYPFRTWLPGDAAGATTGTPEVRPPRSSRTRGSSSQVSYTHGR
jgi:hypothetical protein